MATNAKSTLLTPSAWTMTSRWNFAFHEMTRRQGLTRLTRLPRRPTHGTRGTIEPEEPQTSGGLGDGRVTEHGETADF